MSAPASGGTRTKWRRAVGTVQAMALSSADGELDHWSAKAKMWSGIEGVCLTALWTIFKQHTRCLPDQDGPCLNVLPAYREENLHLRHGHLCWGHWLWERFRQVWIFWIKPCAWQFHYAALLTTSGRPTTKASCGRTSERSMKTLKRRRREKSRKIFRTFVS